MRIFQQQLGFMIHSTSWKIFVNATVQGENGEIDMEKSKQHISEGAGRNASCCLGPDDRYTRLRIHARKTETIKDASEREKESVVYLTKTAASSIYFKNPIFF